MNESEKMARNIVRSLRIAVCEYEHRTGEAPTKIFAELDAYCALQLAGPIRYYPERAMTIGGIPLEQITKRGWGLYLCGDPVPIRDLPSGDVQVIFQDGTREVTP